MAYDWGFIMKSESDAIKLLSGLMTDLKQLPLDSELEVTKEIIDKQLTILSGMTVESCHNPLAVKLVLEDMLAEYKTLSAIHQNEADLVRSAMMNVKSIQKYLAEK
jgi:hypothetical protein